MKSSKKLVKQLKPQINDTRSVYKHETSLYIERTKSPHRRLRPIGFELIPSSIGSTQDAIYFLISSPPKSNFLSYQLKLTLGNKEFE